MYEFDTDSRHCLAQTCDRHDHGATEGTELLPLCVLRDSVPPWFIHYHLDAKTAF